MKKYLKIARIDHWIKNLFIIPGTVIAILLTNASLADVHFLTNGWMHPLTNIIRPKRIVLLFPKT